MTSAITGPEFVDVRGLRLAVWRREGIEPTVLFTHATGFHARCWDQVVARIPNRTIAVDMRGHGRSAKPEPPYHWMDFGLDVAALVRALGLRGVTGVGHSMGGHALAYASTLAPEAFGRLVLVDPVILPKSHYLLERAAPHFARKRRNRWASSEEMFEKYTAREPFRDWDPAVLHDYCAYGLVPASDEGFVLACPPDVEGSIYEGCMLESVSLYGRLSAVEAPVTLIRSARTMRDSVAMDMGASPTAPDLAGKFRECREVVTQTSHFVPMEAPALVAMEIAAG